jgi:hypothetical protein
MRGRLQVRRGAPLDADASRWRRLLPPNFPLFRPFPHFVESSPLRTALNPAPNGGWSSQVSTKGDILSRVFDSTGRLIE